MRGSAHVPTGFGRAKVHSMLQLLSLGETPGTTGMHLPQHGRHHGSQ